MGSPTQLGDTQHSPGPVPQGTMRAVVQDRYGAAEVLRVADLAVPAPGAAEVLIRVHAAGLDRGTWHLMTGRPYLMRPFTGFRAPRMPVSGRDVSGTVVSTGPAVTRFSPGDEVFGIARTGSFADYTVAREDKLAHKPANLTHEQAAAVPVSGLTALQSLRDAGRVERGQKVLVIGASGGVGSYAVQLASAFGAEVTGVCSTAKLDLVRSLGADHVIDYTSEDFADGTRHYDLILEIAGAPSLTRIRRALTPTGTLVVVGGEEGGDLTGGMIEKQMRIRTRSLFIPQRLTSSLCKENGADLEVLAGLLATGEVVPSLDRSYPLEQATEAMRRLEAGKVRGKLAITVQGVSS